MSEEDQPPAVAEEVSVGHSAAARMAEFDDAISSHPGQLAANRWTEVRRVLSIFERNRAELMALVEVIETDPVAQMAVMEDPQSGNAREEFYSLLNQRLHNFLASLTSVVDLVRGLFKFYEGTQFVDDFQRRNSAVASLPCAMFLRRFRNYMLHVGSAPLMSKFSFAREDASEPETSTSFEMFLSCQLLLRWDDWTAGSRQYILDAGEAIRLSEPIRCVAEANAELYSWAFEQFHVMHDLEIDELNVLIDEANTWLGGGGRT